MQAVVSVTTPLSQATLPTRDRRPPLPSGNCPYLQVRPCKQPTPASGLAMVDQHYRGPGHWCHPCRQPSRRWSPLQAIWPRASVAAAGVMAVGAVSAGSSPCPQPYTYVASS
ncbi:hypothetical protein BHE74_00036196 [Ensete ventricosum]|nr:hypothetical protein GW17_00042105 [Ensete ventricosum]RWW57038.1 hypothetical protein BHE74_00036196 [Ensete ventricosum]RZS12826.1 hypothetical protein BHM03_00044327 [Ensete ventricosum]